MTTVIDRIEMIVHKLEDGKIAPFSRKTGLKDRTIRNWFKKKEASPKADSLAIICETYAISGHWLLTGVGEMFQEPENKDQVSVSTPTGLEALAVAQLSVQIQQVNSGLSEAEAMQIAARRLQIALGRTRPSEDESGLGVEKVGPLSASRKRNG